MESCVGAGDIMGVAVPDAAPIEYGDAPAAAHTGALIGDSTIRHSGLAYVRLWLFQKIYNASVAI